MTEAFVFEWLNLLLRVAHVLAAIMWIGDSFLFMWMDSHLSKPDPSREGDVVGELWMTHSGGFYEVVKRKSLGSLPGTLYWFKWESYTTWVTGFFLLSVVYYLPGALLVDPGSPLTHGQAVALSLGVLVGATAIYHLICKTPLIESLRGMGAVGLVLLCVLAYLLGQVLAPRAVFLQIGATIGTIMSSNVFIHIIPAQRAMLKATQEKRPVEAILGQRAKKRSTHNHYLTLPVLFTMLSNHVPALYGHPRAWLVLGLLFVFGVALKVFMNLRYTTHPLQIAGGLASLLAVIALTRPAPDEALAAYADGPRVSYATAEAIVTARCTSCHAKQPASAMFPAAPMGVLLDSPEALAMNASRVFVRAVTTKTMPLGNMTGMTDEERRLLGAWIAQGADAHAPGPSALAPTPAAPPSVAPDLPPAEAARAIYAGRCAACHGEGGGGDGPAAAALTPKPRNFKDVEWQRSCLDRGIKAVILGGGAARGASPLMPANPDLAGQDAVLDELVKIVRSFKGAP